MAKGVTPAQLATLVRRWQRSAARLHRQARTAQYQSAAVILQSGASAFQACARELAALSTGKEK